MAFVKFEHPECTRLQYLIYQNFREGAYPRTPIERRVQACQMGVDTADAPIVSNANFYGPHFLKFRNLPLTRVIIPGSRQVTFHALEYKSRLQVGGLIYSIVKYRGSSRVAVIIREGFGTCYAILWFLS